MIAFSTFNTFKVNYALCDQSMKLGTTLDESVTKEFKVSATPKTPCESVHLDFQNGGLFSDNTCLVEYLFAKSICCFLSRMISFNSKTL